MATLHLIVGLPCSGKTTLARDLERSLPALRLTPDEWHLRLFGDDLNHPKHNTRHNLIETMLWEIAERALKMGTNVILDFGFWAKVERDDYRARAARLGAQTQIHFQDIPLATLIARLAERNAAQTPGTFQIDEARLREWSNLFQPPDADELQSTTDERS